MSSTIDSKVVEMRFDNKHFENNVATTMSTLDKLKQKLHLDGASKGLENVNHAAKNIDMSGLGNGVETVRSKFSALEVMGVTALANITNSAVNAGKRIVSALTIDPVKTGFSEYEMKMDSIKTIVNSTGRELSDVNKLLEELNEYSDQTIYSFKDMTQNIGKFTNAGVGLEDAVLAIKGISNEAAVSGASAQEASRAMYNFSQALSSGYVKLIDWKSIENANMATKEFKQQLIDTAVELGVVTKSGDMYTTSTGKSFNATKNFNDVLQEQWMTTDVLIKTLGKYADENTAIGKKAFAAAQEVTKFTQMWDVLKETAQSGWAKTWELIIGDLNTAKAILTPLTNFFGKIIDTMSDARNRVLQIALDFAKPWQAIADKLASIKKVTDPIKKVIGTLGDFQDIVDRVWLGEFSVWGGNPDRRDMLKDIGYDPRVVQELVNLGDEAWHSGVRYKLSMEEIEAAHKKFGLTMETSKEEIKEATTVLESFTDEQLKNAGLTEEEIRLYRALEKEAKRLGISVGELADEMSNNKGRDMLVESFKNVGKVFVDVGKAIKQAFVDIFNPPSTEELGIRIWGIIKSLKEFTKTLQLTDPETGKLNENGQKLQRTFKGLFALIDIIFKLVGGPVKLVLKLITGLLRALDIPILDVTASIGDALVAFNEWLDSALDFEKMFRSLIAFFKESPKHIKNWFASFKQSKVVQAMIPLLNAAKEKFSALVGVVKQTKLFKSLASYFKPFIDGIKSWADGLKEAENIPKYIFQGLINGLKKGASSVWNSISDIFVNLIEIVKNVLGIHSPSTVFAAIGGFIIAGLIAGLQNGIPDSLGAIKDVFQPMLDWINGIDLGAVMGAAMGLSGIFAIKKTFDSISSVSEGVGSTLLGVGDVLEGVGKVMKKSAGAIKKVIKNTAKVVKSFSKLLNAIAFDITVDAIVKLVKAIVLLAAAIVVLTFIKPGKLWNAVGVIAALAVILVGLTFAMKKINESSMSFSKEGGLNIQGLQSGLLGIGIAILLLGMTAKMLGTLNPDQLKQGLAGLLGAVAMLAVMIVAFGLLVKGKASDNIDKFGVSMAKMAIALLVMAVVAKMLGKMDPEVLKQGVKAIAAFGGIIVGLMAATKLISGSKNVDTVGKTLLKIGLAIGVMAIVAKILGKMDPQTLQQGIIAITAFSGIMVGLMAATKLITGSKNVDKIGKTLLNISLAIGIMAIAAKIISGMDPGQLTKGVVGIAAFGGIIVGLMAATKLVSGSDVGKIGITILAISGAIAAMAITAIILSMVSWEGFVKGTTMIGVFSGIVVGLIAATKLAGGDADKLAKTILSIAGAIAILAVIAVLLSLVPVENMKRGLAIITVLSILVAGLMIATKFSKDCLGNLIAIAATIAVMGIVIASLAKLPAASVITSAIALGGLMLVMTGVLALLIPIGKKASQAAKGALALAALAVPLTLFTFSFKLMSGVQNAIKNAIALSVLATAMTVLMLPLAVVGKLFTSALKGALALTLMAVPLLAFTAVLLLMNNVKNAIPNVTALIMLATTCTLLLLLLIPIGALWMPALIGIAGLTLMAVPLLAFVGVLLLMDKVQNAQQNVLLLCTLLTLLGGLMVILAATGPMATVGVVALTALTSLMVALGLLAVAVGALMTEFPALEEFLGKGMGVLEQLATGLGAVIGNFVAAFAGAVMTILPQLGLCLSQFMVNAMPFIQGAKLVDDAVLKGVGILAAAVLALTAATLLEGILSFMTMGSSLAGLGTELSTFMINAQPFIAGASTLSEDVLTGVKTLAEAVLILTAANVLEGLTSWLTGGSSLEKFGAQLPALGTSLAQFSANLGTFSDEQVKTVNCAAQAIKSLAAASAEIPNTGGLLGAIVGENDLGVFASQFPVLGTGLRNFLNNVGVFSDEQIATVDCAAEAIKKLAAASKEIPNTGGLIGQIVGNNDLGNFAAQFPVLGSGLRNFLNNIGTFSDEQVATVDCAAEAIKKLAEAAKTIPNSGGVWGKLVGENDLGTFADQFPRVGSGIKGFLNNIGTFDASQMDTVKMACQAVKEFSAVAQNLPSTGGFWNKLLGGEKETLESFSNQFPKVGSGISGFANNLGTFSSAKLATVDAGIAAVKSITSLSNVNLEAAADNMDDFSAELPTLGKNVASFATNISAVSLDALKGSIDRVKQLLQLVKDMSGANMVSAMKFSDTIKDIGKTNVSKFIEAFTNPSVREDMCKASKDLGDQVVKGLKDKTDSVETTAEDLVYKAADGVKSKKSAMKSAGKDLGSGLVSGIKSKGDDVYDAGFFLGLRAVAGEKKGQQSNSPSKATIKAGKWIGEGLIIGMGKMMNGVYNAGSEMGRGATRTISSSISKIADMVNSDIDAQPTIRPVLDLSDVRSGVNTLGGMLNIGSTVGVSANVNAISSMMNHRGQNGVDNELVSAINGLRKDLGKTGNTSYTINGVTYDDGSNITDAVKTIVRAARIERRV